MFCKNKLLKYLFPEFKSYKLDDKLYIDSRFFDKYSIRMLNDLGYNNVYIEGECKEEEKRKDIKIVNYRPSRKRKLVETNEYFNVNEWYSPSSLKLAVEEPFKYLVKNKEPKSIKATDTELLARKQGIKYEEYVLNYIKKRVKVTEICVDRPNLNDMSLIKKSFDSIKNGDEVIYQPMLLDTERKIWGIPDFLVRVDIFKKLFPINGKIFPYMVEKVQNNFGNKFYVVIDVKLSGCNILKNSFLSNDSKTRLNKMQIYIYHSILEQMQGRYSVMNYAFILGSKTKDMHNNILKGIEYLGPIDLTEKEKLKFESDIDRGIKVINKVRESKSLKDGLHDPELKPKRRKDYFQFRTSDGYSDIKRKYGFFDELKLNVNESKMLELSEELSKYELVYVDFESYNTLLCLETEEYNEMLNESINQICQIGVYYRDVKSDVYRYKSFFAEGRDLNKIKINLCKFSFFVNELKMKSKKEIKLLSWGRFEEINYKKMRDRYKLFDMSFVDLSYEIKKKEIFPNYMTYSLKKLSNKLREKYRSNFPESYDELDIKNGENAFMELISYYNCKDERRELIKENIEKYNKIDCVLMYRIVEWLGSSKKKIVI